MFRRSDIETLEFAAELAQKSDNTELYKAVMMRYNAFLAAGSQEEKSVKNVKPEILNENSGHDEKSCDISNRIDDLSEIIKDDNNDLPYDENVLEKVPSKIRSEELVLYDGKINEEKDKSAPNPLLEEMENGNCQELNNHPSEDECITGKES